MAISLFVLNIVFIVGSIIFPNKVRGDLVSQSQSSDWTFAGLSFVVEPQSQIVPIGTPFIELRCKGKSISYSDEGMIYTTPESSPSGHGGNRNALIESEESASGAAAGAGRRTMFNSPYSSLNIKDRTEPRTKFDSSKETSRRKTSTGLRKNSSEEKKRNRKTRQTNAAKAPIQYTWYFNGAAVNGVPDPDREFSTNGSLFIKNVGVNGTKDYGEYRCVVSQRNVGAIASRVARIQPPVINRPIVTYPKSSEVFAAGANIFFSCQLRSIPEARLTWEKDGLPITLDNRIFQLPTGSLIINNALTADSGLYRCTAKNYVLRQVRRSPNVTIEVTSSDVSSTQANANNNTMLWNDLVSHNLTTEEGSDVLLPCALPISDAVWTFLPENGTLRPLEETAVLKLKTVTVDQAGFYVCASQSDSKHRRRYSLQVNTQPYFTTVPVNSLTYSPKIVRFNCSALGNPMPKITWYKDGVPLYINGRVKIKANSLVISDTQASDAGIYQCIASNFIRENSVSAILQFKNDKIHPAPRGVKCRPLNSTTILVEWEETKGDIFTLHFVESEGGTEIQSFPEYSNSFEVQDLQPFISYDFYVKRYHKEAGKISPSEQSKIVKCSPQGINVIAQADPTNQTITVNWSAPKTKREIQSYLLQWRLKNKPHNISEVTLNGSTTQFQIQDVKKIPLFEVRVLASYNFLFPKQNLDRILWSSLTWKPSTNENTVLMTSDDLPNVYSVLPPNAFRVQNLGDNSVNISWSNDGHVLLCKVCYSVLNAMGDHVQKSDNCINRSESWVIVNDLQAQKTYEFIITKYLENLETPSKDLAILQVHKGYGEVQNLSAYWLYNTTTALVSWMQPKYHLKIIQYKLRYCPGPNFLKCFVRSYPLGMYSSRIDNLDVTNSVLITMYVEMQNGKGKPISFKLLPLRYNITMEPNPVLGIILGVTISVLCIALCLFLLFRGRRCRCNKDTKHCWKNRSVYTTRTSNSRNAAAPAPLMPSRVTEQLLSEPNQNFEMQCWKQLSAKPPAREAVAAPTSPDEENQQNTVAHPLLEEATATHSNDDVLDSEPLGENNIHTAPNNICRICNIEEIQSNSLIKNEVDKSPGDIQTNPVDDMYKELSMESMTRLKEILIGNNDATHNLANCNNRNSFSVFPNKGNYNNVNGTDILLQLDSLNQNHKRSKSTSPTLGSNA